MSKPEALTGEMIDRLRALAETTKESGHGHLASWAYHNQGHVSVPSTWLITLCELAIGGRAQALYDHGIEFEQ